jgi:hypothetical protein
MLRSKRRGLVWSPILRRSEWPLDTTRAQGSADLSNSALVATVVPILIEAGRSQFM